MLSLRIRIALCEEKLTELGFETVPIERRESVLRFFALPSESAEECLIRVLDEALRKVREDFINESIINNGNSTTESIEKSRVVWR